MTHEHRIDQMKRAVNAFLDKIESDPGNVKIKKWQRKAAELNIHIQELEAAMIKDALLADNGDISDEGVNIMVPTKRFGIKEIDPVMG